MAASGLRMACWPASPGCPVSSSRCGAKLRGWSKDVQRAIFQPVLLAAIAANLVSLTVAGAITANIIRFYLIGLPAMLAGLWVGFKLYGKLDDAAFRKVILVLLLLAGLGLIVPQLL